MHTHVGYFARLHHATEKRCSTISSVTTAWFHENGQSVFKISFCFLSEAGPMPESLMSPILRPPPLINFTELVSDATGALVDQDKSPEMAPLGNHLTPTFMLPDKPKEKVRGPKKCIPLSQRRVPPAKLNLTLDLSHPDYHLIPKSRAVSLTDSADGAGGVECTSENVVHISSAVCTATVSFLL